MKKIIKSFLLMLIVFIGTSGVSAMMEYGIYCEYGLIHEYNGQQYDTIYFKVTADEGRGSIYVDDDQFESVLGVSLESKMPSNPSIFDNKTIDWLKQLGIVDSSNNFKCPTNPFAEEIGQKNNFSNIGSPIDSECHSSGCSIHNVPTSEQFYESYTCDYEGKKNGKKLQIKYSYTDAGHTFDIVYPDGSKKKLVNTQINGNFMPEKDCNDIYFDMNNNTINLAIDTSSGVSNNATLAGLCERYNNNIDKIEHYCSGRCSYPEMVCPGGSSNHNNVSCGDLDGIPAALPVFIKNIINIVKIAVPIILVILGMIDFAKAVTSNDEKGMKEAQSKFVKRCIAGVIVFLVVSVVQLVFRAINTNDTNSMAACIDCFINGKCSSSNK